MIKKYILLLLALISALHITAKNQDPPKHPLNLININGNKHLIFYVTGDGGWNSFSQKLCNELAQKGYTVVSLDSKKYFWQQKTPEQFASDASDIIAFYLKSFNKTEYSILGFSFGADVASFLPNRLEKNLQSKLKSNVLLIPASSTSFEVRLGDMLGFGKKEYKYKILPEISKIQKPVLCIFAQDDKTDLLPLLKTDNNLKIITLQGSHKFNNDIKIVAETVATGL